MTYKRDLTEDEKQELRILNGVVQEAIRRRTAWLDEKMNELSPVAVGEDVYDFKSLQKLGTVKRLYRFWRDRDEGIRDNSLEIEVDWGSGNSSSQQLVLFGSIDQCARWAQSQLDWLSRKQMGNGSKVIG